MLKSKLKKKIRYLLNRGFYKNFILKRFEKIYLSSKGQTWGNWLGVRTKKCPLDLWIYQEIIFETKPDIIIETGTANGGSALFMAGVLDQIGNGKIITVDIEERMKFQHPRIKFILGSSTNDKTVENIKSFILPSEKIMVILDSDHGKDHVLKEMEIYSKLVSNGMYLIVEDTNINGHPIQSDFGPGPMEALEDFLKLNNNFSIDRKRERLLITNNPKGFLQKNYL